MPSNHFLWHLMTQLFRETASSCRITLSQLRVCSLLILTLQMTLKVSGKLSMHHKTAKIVNGFVHLFELDSVMSLNSLWSFTWRCRPTQAQNSMNETKEENKNCKRDEFTELNGAAPNENHVLAVKLADEAKQIVLFEFCVDGRKEELP